MCYAVSTLAGGATLADAHAVRRAVFIDEQGVDEEIEMDGHDSAADHVVVFDRGVGETGRTDRPVATARLRTVDGHGKAERVAVLGSYRGEGLGRTVMALLESIARSKALAEMQLHAQTTVVGFYEALGYETVSDVFYEADIPHVEMRKCL